ALIDAGYKVEHASPPRLEDALEVWLAVVMAEVGLGMMAAVEATRDPSILASVRAMADCAPAADLRSYAEALARRDELRRRWNAFLHDYPLILMPTSCRAPLPWGEDLQDAGKMAQLL